MRYKCDFGAGFGDISGAVEIFQCRNTGRLIVRLSEVRQKLALFRYLTVGILSGLKNPWDFPLTRDFRIEPGNFAKIPGIKTPKL